MSNYEEVDRIGRIPNDWTDCENVSEAIALLLILKKEEMQMERQMTAVDVQAYLRDVKDRSLTVTIRFPISVRKRIL